MKPRIAIIMNSGNRNWCWGTSADSIAEALKDEFDFIVRTEEYIYELSEFNPDVVWSRGAMHVNIRIYKKLPRFIPKTIASFTIGGEFLEGRIEKEMPFENNCWGFLVQNYAAEKAIRATFNGKDRPIFIIPSAVDTDKFKPLKDVKPDEFTVGFAGRKDDDKVRRQKGFPYAQEACEKAGVAFKWCSSEKGERIPHKKMPAWYNGLSCFVLPSFAEGCSNVIMEAMACGIPVLTTPVGYHGETCKNGENVLYITQEPDEIAGKIKELQADPELQKKLSKGAREYAERHSVKAISGRYRNMFRQAYKELAGIPVDKSKWAMGNMLFGKHKRWDIAELLKEDGKVKIKYMGPKPVKKVVYCGQTMVFNPICEVADERCLKFLLHKDREGLFIPLQGQLLEVKPEEPEEIKQMEDDKPEVEEFPYKCDKCDYAGKTAKGLLAHRSRMHKGEQR